MPRTSEVALNVQLAEVLRGKHPLWRDHLHVEQTGVFPDRPRLRPDILVQHPGEQTDRMAMTIIANALTFHSTIAGTHDIASVAELRADRSATMQLALLDTWQRILDEINYWPIFKVASDLLAPIRAPTAQRVLEALVAAADRLAAIGVTTRHDLSGRMFQNLIIDRKFLATFYTLPTSAALLAEVAAHRMPVDWTDLDRYPDLRIADLSCGTGTLLSAAYHSVLTRYRNAGGDDRQVHQAMIERAVVAADIMPAAAHLCASQLSSVHPTVAFDNTRVYTMPYGIGTGDERFRAIAIGSLDLIDADQTLSLFATGQQQATGSKGDVDVSDINLPKESVDLVIMNPPFTRPTNHEIAEVPVPSFAGFQTTGDEQRAMSDRLARIRGTVDAPAGHGNAGLASNFIDLAHAKVKPGGVVALVLPIAAVQGRSWKAARDLLVRHYSDVTVVAIAASGNRDRAFSADTGMAEALIVATRRPPGSPPDDHALFVNLRRRPPSLLEAAEAAKLVTKLPRPTLAGHVEAGDQLLASYVRAPLAEGGCAALREPALAGAMIALQDGELRLPRYRPRVAIAVATLGDIGQRGLVDRDIGNRNAGRPPFRGPFRIRPVRGPASYPMLWSHNAGRERCMLVQPDTEGEVRPGCEDRAVDEWQTATRLHYTRDFQLNSQSLAACLTPGRTLGGRAWPNFGPAHPGWQEILALWANSTLGLMCFWWVGSRQQQGRSVLTISGLPSLTTIDPRALKPSQLHRAADTIGRFQGERLLPANEAYRDATRKALDRAVLVDILEVPEDVLPALDNLRDQWCSEPSVHGGKSTAPEDVS